MRRALCRVAGPTVARRRWSLTVVRGTSVPVEKGEPVRMLSGRGVDAGGGSGAVTRLVLGLALALAGVLAAVSGALAAPTTITYTTCPSFSQFQSDVQAIGGTGTVTFGPGAANCPITATGTITLHYGASVTIDGNGLTLSGGSANAKGTFDLLDLDAIGNLSLDHLTLEDGQQGVGSVVGADGTVTLTDGTVTSNGGTGLTYGTVIVTDSTVSGNGGDGINANHVTVTASTVSGNGGNGIHASMDATGSATLLDGNGQNCIVLGDSGPITDLGYNLSTDGSCGFSATGSQNNVPAASLALGPLNNNGGPTQTQALGLTSIAVDAIPLNGGACAAGATVDQRGVSRPQGAGCDVGAYELLVPTVTPANASAQDVAAGVTLSATVTTSCGTSGTYCPIVGEGTVTFTVTDAGSNVVGTPVSQAVSSGAASASYNPHGLAPGSYTITAAYTDAAGNFADSAGTSTLTITAGPPATVTLAPGSTTNTVGTPVTETATVEDALGYPVADGTTVNFTVTGITTTSGSATTTNGQASFSYGAILPGTDTLTATAQGGTTPSATATINWSLPASTAGASLGIVNFTSPYVYGSASTGTGGPYGILVWRDGGVSFLATHVTALTVSGPDATLFGTATLTTGQTVTFRLDAVTGANTVELRLGNGYDSGTLPVMSVRVTP